MEVHIMKKIHCIMTSKVVVGSEYAIWTDGVYEYRVSRITQGLAPRTCPFNRGVGMTTVEHVHSQPRIAPPLLVGSAMTCEFPSIPVEQPIRGCIRQVVEEGLVHLFSDGGCVWNFAMLVTHIDCRAYIVNV